MSSEAHMMTLALHDVWHTCEARTCAKHVREGTHCTCYMCSECRLLLEAGATNAHALATLNLYAIQKSI